MSDVFEKDSSLEVHYNTSNVASESQIIIENSVSMSMNDSKACKELTMELKKLEVNSLSETKSTLTCLNDDCLLYVLSMLSFEDRMVAERVCKRWQTLCQILWNKQQVLYANRVPFMIKYDKFRVYYERNANVLPEQLPNALIRCGNSLKKLYIYSLPGCTQRTLETIKNYCTNLESLEIHGLDLLMDLDSIGKCFITNLKNLVILKLRVNCNINDEILKVITTCCVKLEILDISLIKSRRISNIGIEAIVNLPDLKELNVIGLEINDDGLRLLSRARKLTKLFCSGSSLITDDGAIAILDSCENLIKFHLACCSSITLRTVQHAIKVMKTRKGNLPLCLHVCFTRICKKDLPKPLPSLLKVLIDEEFE